MDKNLLIAQQLRKTYSPKDFASINEAIPKYRKGIIGQERAVKALKFGLGNRSLGFNVYVSTHEINGIYSVIKHFLKEMAQKDPLPHDWCYVNNFKNPYCPKALSLPKGLGSDFKKDLDNFVTEAKVALAKSFESEEYTEALNTIKQELSEKQQELFLKVSNKAKEENFILKRSPSEIMVTPLKGDKAITDEEFQQLPEKKRKELLAKQNNFQLMLDDIVKRSTELERKTVDCFNELEQKTALFALENLLESIRKKYKEIAKIPEHLEAIKADILDNLSFFIPFEDPIINPQYDIVQKKMVAHRYKVNIIVDNSEATKAPIVVEINPTYSNLFGKIEREAVMGALETNFTLIREGALHRANGGYLILPIEDLLRSPFSWETLKRALRNRQISIEDPNEKYGFITTRSLNPEPIDLNVQIVLLGRHHLFQLLYQHDEDFKSLFKVKAQFDSTMPASIENIKDFCGYLYCIQKEENLLPISNTALAKLLEHGHRLADHQKKISTSMGEIADLVREANYYAQEEDASEISDQFIQKTIDEKRYRSNLIPEKIKELIEENIIMIDTTDKKIGQINGLSVMSMGDLAFGRPNRITSSISIGKGGIIDIEREANLGGDIHTKGVLILSGFLFDKFGKDKIINPSIRLVFEQSYGGIDGDSASSAELYAILSGLSDLPIQQGIAVTGSVNQHGEIQAIGGVNEKIEGYFEVCQQIGLTGMQGVIIPAANIANLMLKKEIVDAVVNKQFHVWAIHRVEEGIEILTGVKAGTAVWDIVANTMKFEKDTVYDKVNKRLKQMTEVIKKKRSDDEKNAFKI